MTAISRREFLRTTAAGTAAAGYLARGGAAAGAPLGLPIGSQTYPHRQMIVDGNFVGLCKMMSDIGIQSVELCSPGYKEFSSLKDGKQTKQILADHGLTSTSAHFTMGELRKTQDAAIQWAKDVGMTQMVTATLSGPTNPTMDQVKAAADEYNKIAAAAAAAGLQQALHNEGFEASMVEGRRVYNVLYELLDPKLVKFQFQMSSARGLGVDPVEFLTTNKGRFISLHLQGVPPIAPPAAAPTPPATPAAPDAAAGARRGGGRGGPQLPVGKDSLDWAKVFAAARIGGIRNYFVEQNWELTQQSVAFLKTLNV